MKRNNGCNNDMTQLYFPFCKIIYTILLNNFERDVNSTVFNFLFVGTPMPKANWTKNGNKLPNHIDTTQTPDFTKIKLKKTTRSDAGDYEVELKNNVGTAKVPITIKVVGK